MSEPPRTREKGVHAMPRFDDALAAIEAARDQVIAALTAKIEAAQKTPPRTEEERLAFVEAVNNAVRNGNLALRLGDEYGRQLRLAKGSIQVVVDRGRAHGFLKTLVTVCRAPEQRRTGRTGE